MDPIADMLTIIRNGLMAKKEAVVCPHSRMKFAVARTLEAEGFVGKVVDEDVGGKKQIVITLRYRANGLPFIGYLQRVSKPGRRVYLGYKELRKVRNGLGVSILSTSKGVMTDEKAKGEKAGGEVVCEVY